MAALIVCLSERKRDYEAEIKKEEKKQKILALLAWSLYDEQKLHASQKKRYIYVHIYMYIYI